MNKQRLIILNRAAPQPADGWIHIVPQGELPNAEAGIVQVLDEPALDSILANLEQEKSRLGGNWPGVYAGREHFIYDAGKDSEALAWFKHFEKRPNGIWAKADGLTDIGRDALKNRRYKFTSFVTDPADLEPLSRDQSTPPSSSSELPRYRVMKIETIGFTNQANGRELLTPITNRTDAAGANFFAGADASADSKHHGGGHGPSPQTKGSIMKSVCTLLGLSADADEPAVHAAVAKLLNRGDIAADALAALRAEHRSLGEQNHVLLDEQAEALLDGCGVREEKIRNRLKDGMKRLKNRQERLGYLADFGFEPGKTAAHLAAGAGRVLNRGTGGARESLPITFAETEQTQTLKIRNRAEELRGQSRGRTFDDCWKQAQRELLNKH
jgi:hypothetical protein